VQFRKAFPLSWPASGRDTHPRPGRTRGRRWGALLALFALLPVACTSPPVTGPPPAPPMPEYVVGAPDQLEIRILPDPEIILAARVRPDGMISIDLIGEVKAAGRTPFEIAQTIQTEISRYKRDASVSVAVLQSPSQFVTIYGEVGAPGTFALDTKTRASEAIGRVGGPRPFAKLNGVRIVRTRGTKAEILKVRLNDIKHGDLSTNFVIEEGDLIIVPPTILARFGYAMQMLFFPFQPLFGAATSVGGVYTGYQAVGN
jgi:polysaccharide export outer membrane protein